MSLVVFGVCLSSAFALSSALFLYLSAPAQTVLRGPLPRKIGWGGASIMWGVCCVVLWRVFSCPAALSLAVLMVMLCCMFLAFVGGLWSALKRRHVSQSSQRNA
ncbi:hypothetical protein [Neokomagataea thailandica]|uniref:hypothetical protein n=1 Tax=Neokomagataea TaxID=1223423 RepID=UPI0008368507|nr:MULTISPECIES: hypothetical protein [Neokomagataea]